MTDFKADKRWLLRFISNGTPMSYRGETVLAFSYKGVQEFKKTLKLISKEPRK